MASRGERIRTSFPNTRIVPRSMGSAPTMARASSVLPEPTSPAIPTTSPTCARSEMSCSTPRRSRCSTESASAPRSATTLGNFSVISRPTIRRMIWSTVTSAISRSATLRPSRSTVEVEQRSLASSR